MQSHMPSGHAAASLGGEAAPQDVSASAADLCDALTAAVRELTHQRLYHTGRTVAGPSARARHAQDMKHRRERIEQLADAAREAGVEVRDEIDTPFEDYRCRECLYFGGMTLRRDLVANEQVRVCPSCGEVQPGARWADGPASPIY